MDRTSTDSMSGKWESSGATDHTKECHGQFNWLHLKTVTIHVRKENPRSAQNKQAKNN